MILLDADESSMRDDSYPSMLIGKYFIGSANISEIPKKNGETLMTQSSFLLLYANLAATSEDDPPPDKKNKYWKVQTVVEAVQNARHSLLPEEYNCIDEQMIPFHDRMLVTQHVKNREMALEFLRNIYIQDWEDQLSCNLLRIYQRMKISKSSSTITLQVYPFCWN